MPEPARILEERFGFRAFRPGQSEVIESILSGRPTLAVMPTGSGKSLCYQLPAVMFEGLTVVVSPLVALIRDQVRALRARGIAAASLTSHDDPEDRRDTLDAIRANHLDLVYVAPERFKSPRFTSALERARVALFTIDEAHCISQWGHDFRPDYAKLGDIITTVQPQRIAALTATATPSVRDDICRRLGLSNPNIVVTGFDRPNLALSVAESRRGKAKLDATIRALNRHESGAAIVYVATRKKAEEVAEELARSGFDAHAYHAGLSGVARRRVEQHFDEGDRPVVVATTAFGMGIDRSDVRSVIHYQIPSSPEAYYQEVGRAGRDGAPATGVLVWDQGDLRHAHLRFESSCPTPEDVARVFDAVRDEGDASRDFEGWVRRAEQVVGPPARAALIALEQAKDLRFVPGGVEIASGSPRVDPQHLAERARRERARLDAMIGYVTRAACRRRYLVDYFGDSRRPEHCGACDRCLGPEPEVLSGDAHRHALIALSCIARMRGRYGKGRVVEVLVGADTDAVRQSGLDRLSTHGLLSHFTKTRALELLDALVRTDYARITGADYPTIRLTERGAAALKEEATIALEQRDEASKPPRRKDRPPDVPPEQRALFEALKAWRSNEARAQGKPPYVVAHDRLLADLCENRPRSREELSAIPGIGPSKLEKYGDQLLAMLAEDA